MLYSFLQNMMNLLDVKISFLISEVVPSTESLNFCIMQ